MMTLANLQLLEYCLPKLRFSTMPEEYFLDPLAPHSHPPFSLLENFDPLLIIHVPRCTFLIYILVFTTMLIFIHCYKHIRVKLSECN